MNALRVSEVRRAVLFFKFERKLFMAVLLFLLWIILNGRFTTDLGMVQIIISGLIVTLLVYIFAMSALGLKPKAELYFWRNAFLLIYLLWFFAQISLFQSA